MTDITINIKTGSENNEPQVTTTTDNTSSVPKTESPKEETPTAETKEEPILENESAKKEDPSEINMMDKEQAIMGDDKTIDSEQEDSKQDAPKGVMREDKTSEKDDAKKMTALSSDRDMSEEEDAKMGSEK